MAIAEQIGTLEKAILAIVETSGRPMAPGEVEEKLNEKTRVPTAQVRDALLWLISLNHLSLTPDRLVELKRD